MCMERKQISINGILDSWGYQRSNVNYLLNRYKDMPVLCVVNSLGGNVNEGLAISKLFEQHGDVVVRFIGCCASAATWMAFGAKEIEIAEDAFLMVHNCSNLISIYKSMKIEDIESTIKELESVKKSQEAFNLTVAKKYAARDTSRARTPASAASRAKAPASVAPRAAVASKVAVASKAAAKAGTAPASADAKTKASCELSAWLARYGPVEREIIEAHERRIANRARNRAAAADRFADLCEATEGFAVVWRREGWSVREMVRWAGGDVLTLLTLTRWLRTEATRYIDRAQCRLRRPLYYAQERARREALAKERRRVGGRRTTSPCPTREAILDAWVHRR